MNKLVIIVAVVIIALVVIVIASGAFYTIDESQQVLITQFGEIIGDPIVEPGLHYKTPFIQDANYYDKRLLEWEGEKTVSKTKEQKFINVAVYARWKIVNAKLYRETVSGLFEIASGRLDAIIDPIVRDVIAEYTLTELVRSDTEKVLIERVLKENVQDSEVAIEEAEVTDTREKSILERLDELFEKRESRIQKGRSFIAGEILRKAKGQIAGFGIELVDVRMLSINYQPQTRQQVYRRMIAERNTITALYLSDGESLAAEWQGRKARRVLQIQSAAEKRVQELIGQGEAQAIETYANAYNRDAEFYKFYQTLETLKQTVDNQTWLILSTDSDFYKLLKSLPAR